MLCFVMVPSLGDVTLNMTTSSYPNMTSPSYPNMTTPYYPNTTATAEPPPGTYPAKSTDKSTRSVFSSHIFHVIIWIDYNSVSTVCFDRLSAND